MSVLVVGHPQPKIVVKQPVTPKLVFPVSMPGAPGDNGLSAYEIWLENGNTGTEQDFLDSLVGPPGATTWDEISGKPSTFAPSAHTHTTADVTGLDAALAAKLEISEVTATPTASKVPRASAGGWLDSWLSTAIARISDLTWANISGKPSTFTPSAHTHATSDVTGLDAALGAKLEISEVTATPAASKVPRASAGGWLDSWLSTAIARISDLTWANISGKPSTFTPSAHTHTTSDVTGLDAALTGKEPAIASDVVTKYWAGTKTWRDFATDAIAAVATRLLPSGGTTGQVLSKTSATDYAVAWSTPSSGSSIFPLFRYIVNQYLSPIVTKATISTGSFQAGRYYFAAVPIERTVTLDRIQAEVTTLAAGGNFLLGIYDAHPTTGRPRNLLASSGALSTAATGVISATISVTLSPGMYFFTLQQSTAFVANFRCLTAGILDPGRDSLIGTQSYGVISTGLTYTGTMLATMTGTPDAVSGNLAPFITARISALP